PTGLYTTAEITARMNYRLYEFVKRTGCLTSTSNHLTSVVNQRDYSLDNKAVDLMHVAFEGTPAILTSLPNGSTLEVDSLLTDVVTSVDPPSIYTIELGDVNSISILPAPNVGSREIHLIYIRRPVPLTDPPDTTALDLPAD